MFIVFHSFSKLKNNLLKLNRDFLAIIANKCNQCVASVCRIRIMKTNKYLWSRAKYWLSIFCICTISTIVQGSDITANVFGGSSEGIIGAFGDFNSDELTDVFILKNDGKTLEILLGADVEPLLRHAPNLKCEFQHLEITSVVPGDFDGDAFMDLLITTKIGGSENLGIYINWGGSEYLNCTNENEKPIIEVFGQPVALDYNKDMIIDLFGLDVQKSRTFWVFNSERKTPNITKMIPPHDSNVPLSVPHAHAYLDLNNDFTADLFVTTNEHFEIWHGLEEEGFVFDRKISLPTVNEKHVGQTLFLDIELKGNMNQILPICFDTHCQNSTILVHAGNHFHDLRVNFKDNENQQWGFVIPNDKLYTSTITLRGGDFNMDGYPDLLVALAKQSGQPQTFLLENVPCDGGACGPLTRKFEIKWKALAPFSNGTVMGAFYDFYQDGILDVIFVEQKDNRYRQVAFRNTLDYDANFVKVIVLTGLSNTRDPTKLTPLGRKKRTYGKMLKTHFT